MCAYCRGNAIFDKADQELPKFYYTVGVYIADEPVSCCLNWSVLKPKLTASCVHNDVKALYLYTINFETFGVHLLHQASATTVACTTRGSLVLRSGAISALKSERKEIGANYIIKFWIILSGSVFRKLKVSTSKTQIHFFSF